MIKDHLRMNTLVYDQIPELTFPPSSHMLHVDYQMLTCKSMPGQIGTIRLLF